jgi:hypothetical protein
VAYLSLTTSLIQIKLEADLIYPSFTEPFLHCTIGASIDNQQLISNSWCGRLGAIYFFSSILTPELQQTLLEQGPDHCIRVSTDSERATILKSVKKIATTAISTFSSLFSVFNSSDSSSNSASNSHQNVLSNIAFAYHAANTQDRVCLDCSPLDPSTCQKQSSEVEYAVTAKMSGSLQACVHSKPADVFFLSFGGLLSLLPMFAHIQTLQSQSSEMTLFPLAISTLSELLSQSSLNQSHFLSHHGFAMLGLLLQQFEFPIDSFSLQSVQRLLCSLSYSSFYLAADTLKRIDNKSEHDESDLSVNFQQSLDWSQDFNSNLDILSVSNGNSSLFSEVHSVDQFLFFRLPYIFIGIVLFRRLNICFWTFEFGIVAWILLLLYRLHLLNLHPPQHRIKLPVLLCHEVARRPQSACNWRDLHCN